MKRGLNIAVHHQEKTSLGLLQSASHPQSEIDTSPLDELVDVSHISHILDIIVLSTGQSPFTIVEVTVRGVVCTPREFVRMLDRPCWTKNVPPVAPDHPESASGPSLTYKSGNRLGLLSVVDGREARKCRIMSDTRGKICRKFPGFAPIFGAY